MWTCLIEKAFAKLFGEYKDINEGGFPYRSLRKLTGAPTYYLRVLPES